MNQNLIKKLGLFISPLAISPVIAFGSSTNQIKAQSPQYTLTNVNKKVDVLPQGINWKNVNKEQRKYSHSELTPTGFFVPKNTKVFLEFDQEINQEILINFKVRIGQWGSYSNLNGGARWGLMTHDLKVDPLNSRRAFIISKLEGMFYLVNRSQTKIYSPQINASNVVIIPTANLDRVDNLVSDYASQKQPPFIELVSKNMFITVDTKMFENKMEFLDWTFTYQIDDLIKGLEQVFYANNRFSGLENYSRSPHYKHPNKIHFAIIGSQKKLSYVTNEYIGINLEGGEKLLTTIHPQYNWLLWDAIGQTYQNNFFIFNESYAQATVNIGTLWIEEHLGYKNKFISLNKEKKIVKDFLAQNNKVQNSIDKLNIWEKSMMFWQLHMGYGKEFYPRLHQDYRLLSQNDWPINDYQKRQMFIVMTSKLVKRNLIPFFDKWSIYADQNTINQVQGYSLLSKDIWNNILDNNFGFNTIVDYTLEER